MWQSGTTVVQDLDENTAQSALESAFDDLKGSYPELNGATKAFVRSKPHDSAKADGRIVPLHASFQITDSIDQPITSAHTYASPLGRRCVWFSKPKYNIGEEAKQHFPPNPVKKDLDDKATTGQQGGGRGTA